MLALALLALSVVGAAVGALVWSARGWLKERARSSDRAVELGGIRRDNSELKSTIEDQVDEHRRAVADYEAQLEGVRVEVQRLNDEKLLQITERWHAGDPALREYLDALGDGLSKVVSQTYNRRRGEG